MRFNDACNLPTHTTVHLCAYADLEAADSMGNLDPDMDDFLSDWVEAVLHENAAWLQEAPYSTLQIIRKLFQGYVVRMQDLVDLSGEVCGHLWEAGYVPLGDSEWNPTWVWMGGDCGAIDRSSSPRGEEDRPHRKPLLCNFHRGRRVGLVFLYPNDQATE